MITTSTSPASSISVQARLKFADSLIPRKLIAVTIAITASATSTVGSSTNSLR